MKIHLLAQRVGNQLQHPHTGFIHFNELIPLFENFCFALSLFRTHIRAYIEEGKELLKKLFCFNIDGGFPRYLHEYPKKGSSNHQLRLALPLYWILKKYEHVIESPLKQDLKKYLNLLLKKVDPSHLSPLYKVFYEALKHKEIKKNYTPRFSYEWGEFLLLYQLLNENPEWILKGALENFDPKLMAYVGKPFQEYQRKNGIEVGLYDFFMAEYYKEPLKKFDHLQLLSIQGALVFPFQKKREEIKTRAYICQESDLGKEKWNPKGFHLIRLLWGTKDKTYSFVCQTPLSFERQKEDYLFIYPQKCSYEKGEIELAFYVNYDPDLELRVKGVKQTVFYLNEPIEIQTKEKKIKLILSLKKGEGEFMGHISRGNRPAQLESGKEIFPYDWKIGLRTIRRTEEVVICLRILE